VVFPNHGHDLLPGLYVRAVLSEGTDAEALLVPQPAVSRDTKGNASVMVVKTDGTVEVRPLELSRVLGDKWLVSSGLAAGERVIVDGLQKVRPGAKVKAVEAAAAAPDGQADGQANATQANAAQPAAAQPAAAKAAAAQSNATKMTPEPKAAPTAKKAEPAKAAVKAEKPAEPKAEAKAKTEAPAKAKAEAPNKTKTEAPAKTPPQPETSAKAQPEASDKAKADAAAKAKKEERKAYSPPEGERPVSTLDSRPAGQ
jgi:membrane fusion protein, multidrug efflux system